MKIFSIPKIKIISELHAYRIPEYEIYFENKIFDLFFVLL